MTANRTVPILTLMGLLALGAVCYPVQAQSVQRVIRATTAPDSLKDMGRWATDSGPSFRNISHAGVSPFWAHRKSDGSDFSPVNLLSRILGIDWLPVALKPDSLASAGDRAFKRTACGRVTRTSLFIAPPPTREFDWTFHIEPNDRTLLDTAVLRENSNRVLSYPRVIRSILDLLGQHIDLFDGTAKEFAPEKWSPGIIEAEVTPPKSLLASGLNPFKCSKGKCRLGSRLGFNALGDQPFIAPHSMCAYGVFIQEAVHHFQPEIHPAEALYWRDTLGAWNLLMLQDASDRFDARRAGRWFTVVGAPDAVSNSVSAEHWVQEAMIGEFAIPLGPDFREPLEVTLIGQDRLDDVAVSHGDYPASPAPTAAATAGVRVSDPRIQAAIIHKQLGDAGFLIIRARIRGGLTSDVFENEGAFAHLRITGARQR